MTVAGLGGLNPRPVNAPQGAAPASGVQPGQSPGVVIANRVIVFGPGDGIFIYSGTPGPNTLIASDASAGGTDPFGNVYLAGPTTYRNMSPLVLKFAAQQLDGAGTAFYLSTGFDETGPWIQQATIRGWNNIVDIFASQIILTAASSVKIMNGIAFINPSGDNTGATDLAAIQVALNSGFEVQLVPGIYYVNAPVELPNSAVIRGVGRPEISKNGMAVIQAAASIPAVLVSTGWLENTQTTFPAGGVNIFDLKIDGNSLASNGILLQTADSTIRNVSVENTKFEAIEFTTIGHDGTTILTGSASNNRIESCSLNNCGGYGIVTVESAGNSVFTDGFITDCIIAGCTSAGISLQRAGGWLVSGNHLYGLSQHGIQLGVMDNTRVLGNYIETWGTTTGVGAWRAIDAYTNPTNVIEPSVIAGNTIWLGSAPGNASSTIEGINMRAATGVTASWSLVNNTFDCIPAAGFANATAITWTNQTGTAGIVGVTTANNVRGNWSSAVVQVPNGGTITLSAGV